MVGMSFNVDGKFLLCVIVLFFVSGYQRISSDAGLVCHSCSGKDMCRPLFPNFTGKCRTNPGGKCFVREDPNGGITTSFNLPRNISKFRFGRKPEKSSSSRAQEDTDLFSFGIRNIQRQVMRGKPLFFQIYLISQNTKTSLSKINIKMRSKKQ